MPAHMPLTCFKALKQVRGMWAGIVYGAVLWAVVFYLFNPMFPDVQTVAELKRETIVTTLCIYLLYGLFVGYSISFEYNELNSEKSTYSEHFIILLPDQALFSCFSKGARQFFRIELIVFKRNGIADE